jgi:hypothetical protein
MSVPAPRFTGLYCACAVLSPFTLVEVPAGGYTLLCDTGYLAGFLLIYAIKGG